MMTFVSAQIFTKYCGNLEMLRLAYVDFSQVNVNKISCLATNAKVLKFTDC